MIYNAHVRDIFGVVLKNSAIEALCIRFVFKISSFRARLAFGRFPCCSKSPFAVSALGKKSLSLSLFEKDCRRQIKKMRKIFVDFICDRDKVVPFKYKRFAL